MNLILFVGWEICPGVTGPSAFRMNSVERNHSTRIFLILRRKGEDFVVDILEPHDDSRLDTWAKVKGLAKFADKHGVSFGRLMVGRKVGESLEIVDVSDHKAREKARNMGAPADLQALFEEVD